MRLENMRAYLTIFILSVFVQMDIAGQGLHFFADVMRNAEVADHRKIGATEFDRLFIEELQRDGFDRSFDELHQWVSFLYDPDSTFRVITWQVDCSDTMAYRGLIQKNSGEVVSLVDKSGELEDIEYDILGPEDWHGALYYDIVSLNASTHILLGYNGLYGDQARKIAEVLDLEDDLQFGKEIFVFKDDEVRPTVKTRILLDYSKLGAVRLTYDRDEKLLFFDNLIAVDSYEKQGEVVLVQDGSFNGYYLKGDKLYYKEKLFTTSVDEPPRERPKTTSDKDLFGNPK